MTSSRPLIFLVEDSLTLALLYKDYLRSEPFEVVHFAQGLPVLEQLEKQLPQGFYWFGPGSSDWLMR